MATPKCASSHVHGMIGQHHGTGVPGANASAVERPKQVATIAHKSAASPGRIPPWYDGRVIRVDGGRTFDEA